MPKIISSTTLRNSFNEVSAWCHETGNPTFVTRNGAGDLAVMSLEAYEALTDRLDLLDALAQGRQDVEAGRIQPAREHVSSLRQRYGLS